jgi:hypothetical protein
LVVLALFATLILALASVVSPVRADDDKRGISGTVVGIDSTSLRIAARTGVKIVFIDADTEIKNGRKRFTLSSISRGDKISASVEELNQNQFLARKISVRTKKGSSKIQHMTGVVIKRINNRSFTLATRDGRSRDIELEDDDANEAPEIAEVVTTIVEADPKTGKAKAKQVERVERIVQRLEDRLSKQVDKAKASVLRKIIDENSRQHLDTLNQTLDLVEAEAREKIETALEKFRTDYAAVAERVGNAPPEETYAGVIAEITGSSFEVSSTSGDGSRAFTVTAETDIVIVGIDPASTADLEPGQTVTVSFVPNVDESDAAPFASVIEAVPPALPPVVADAIEDLSDGVVEGEITSIEDQDDPGSTIVIVEEDETGDTIGVEVTPDTDVIVDGQPGTTDDLEAEQQIEVTVEEDGVTADSIVATSETTSETPESFSGVVTAVDADRRVIVVAPPVGEAIRLTVDDAAVITIDGVSASLTDVLPQDLVLETSTYVSTDSTAFRLAVARPTSVGSGDENDPETTPTVDPTVTPGSGGTSPTSTPFSIRGFVQSFEGDVLVFDGMTLPKSAGFSLPSGAGIGSEVDFVFTIAPDGSVVLSGIQLP